MRSACVIAFLALVACISAQDRWYVQGQYEGGCPNDRATPLAITASPVGCVPVGFGTNIWNYNDCQNNTLIQKLQCNTSTCDYCLSSFNRTFNGNITGSECSVVNGKAYITECTIGEPKYPKGAPIVKYYTQLKCKGTPYSAAATYTDTFCAFGAKAYCDGSKAVAEKWADDNCSTTIDFKVKSGPLCLAQNQNPNGPDQGSFLSYCGASALAPVAIVAILLVALLTWS